MSNTIAYLTSRSNFLQVSQDIPVTKQRNPDKVDAPDVFEGMLKHRSRRKHPSLHLAARSKQKGARRGLDGESEAGRVPDTVSPSSRA